jgi:hypothetical protein
MQGILQKERKDLGAASQTLGSLLALDWHVEFHKLGAAVEVLFQPYFLWLGLKK